MKTIVKQPAYEMALPKGRIILLGELSEGDADFVREWLKRIEAAEHPLHPTGGDVAAESDIEKPASG